MTVGLARQYYSEFVMDPELNKIDQQHKYCTMGISLVNDRYKNRTIGTAVEKLTLQ